MAIDYGNAFRNALEIDLEGQGMTEASLARRMGLTQQAINKWVKRGFPPASRVKELTEILGANGQFAGLDHSVLYIASRTPNPAHTPAPQADNTPVSRYDLLDVQRGHRLQFVSSLPEPLRVHVSRNAFSGVIKANEMDYMSRNVGAEVIVMVPPRASKNTSASMLRLAILQKTNPSIKKLALIIITQAHDVGSFPSALFRRASEVFGIPVLEVLSGEAAADVIEDLEEWVVDPDAIDEPDE